MPKTIDAPIKPRTTEERRAYISGYVAAVNDVNERGVRFGATQCRLLADSENSIAARKGEPPPYDLPEED